MTNSVGTQIMHNLYLVSLFQLAFYPHPDQPYFAYMAQTICIFL